MKRRTRTFLGLLCLLWAAQAFPEEREYPELAWIPPGPDLLMCYERSPTADDDLFRRFQDEFLFASRTRSDFQKLLSLTDLDPTFHVDRLVVSVFTAEQGQRVLAMLRTSRPEIAERALSASDEVAASDSNPKLFCDPFVIDRRCVGFLDSRLIVFGNADLVEESFSRASGSSPRDVAGQESPLADIDTGSDFWAIASQEWLGFDFSSQTLASASIGGRSLCQGLMDIEAVSYSARVSSRVELEMRAHGKDGEDAVILSDALDQFLDSALAGSRPFPDLHSAVQTARTERSREVVRLTMRLDRGALRDLYHSETGRRLITWRLGEESREARQNIRAILEALDIGAGSHVADLGAGGGFFTVRLARAVGREGLVYAEDIREEITRSLKERVQRASLANVKVVLGQEDDPLLPEGALDAVLIVNAYHEMDSYDTMLSHIRRALKPRGRLVLIEPFDSQRAGDSREAQMEKHVIDPDIVEHDLHDAGLEIVERHDTFIPHQGPDGSRFDWLIVAAR